MRVIVTGSRDWPYLDIVWSALNRVWLDERKKDLDCQLTVIEGACPTGADDFAYQWAMMQQGMGKSVYSERYPADWKAHGKAAGPKRNGVMVDRGANAALAFRLNNSRGTTDCMTKLKAAGILVKVYDLNIKTERSILSEVS